MRLATSARVALATGLVACELLLACGSTEDDHASIDRFFRAVVSIVCDSLAQCCAASKLPFDADACAELALLVAPTEGPVFFPDVADQCLADLKVWVAATCVDGPSPPSCDRVFSGSVKSGGACMSSAECEHPPDRRVTCADGTCRTIPPPEVGQSCGDPTETEFYICPFGAFYCDFTDDICKATAHVGEPCNPPQCDAESYCDLGTKTCVPYHQPGEPCEGGCARGAYCREADGVCAQRTPLGSPCTQFNECEFGYCDILPGAGTCTLTYTTCPHSG